MGKIYVNQTKLRLQLNTGVSIESGDAPYIKYKKPDSDTVLTLVAEILDPDDGSIYYDFKDESTSETLDTVGVWMFWSYIVFNDGLVAPGEPVSIRVYEEGN